MDLTPPIIADGSVHTEIEARIPSTGLHPVLFNERNPDLVRRVHQDFAIAGARALRTNTRGANRVVMSSYEMEERCEAFNTAASALLLDVAGVNGIRMGAIGAIGAQHDGRDIPAAERDRAYAEQIIYLSDTGAAFFLLEHFNHVQEVIRLLRVVRRNSDAPVLAQLMFDERNLTLEGLTPKQAARQLVDAGADALGISCGPAIDRLPAIVDDFLEFGIPVSLMSGISRPGREPPFAGAASWEPSQFADHLAPFADRGVAILGGCCGVGPDHIAALKNALGASTGTV